MTFRFFTFLICIGVYSIAYTSANAQTGASGRVEKFRALYEDSSGVWIDSLPTAEDSVFIKNKKYYFTGVNSRGKETGLDAFDDLTLNLSLTVGEEEERQLGWFTRAVSWTGNNLIRILSLTFYDPEWGANRYFFNAETFANDLKVINQLYNDKGYFDATIVKYTAKFDKHRESIEITIYIYEGEPTTLVDDPDIHIQSPIPVADPGSKFQRKKILPLLTTRKGDPLDRINIESSKAAIQRLFSQNGYFAAEVTEQIDTAATEKRKARLEYTVTPGRYAVFGKTKMQGNYYKDYLPKGTTPDTTDKIVEDYVPLRKVRYREGRPFNPDRLNLSMGQINGLGVFRSAKPIMNKVRGSLDSSTMVSSETLDSILHKSSNRITQKGAYLPDYGIPVDTLHITIAVAERKERSIKPGVGFTTDFSDLPEGEAHWGNLPFLALQLSWQSRNFYGGARKMQVSAQVSKGFEQDKFFANFMETKISFRQPTFKIPMWDDADNDLLTTLSAQRNNTVSYDAVTVEVTPTIIRQITAALNVNFTPFAFKAVDTRRAATTNDINEAFTTNTRAGLTYNTANDFFYPTEGVSIFLTSDFAGFVLPSDLKFIKLNLDNRKYFGLTDRLSLAVRARGGSAIPYEGSKGSEIPVTEKFYGGGPNSVRSWGIRELGIVAQNGGTLTYSGGNSIMEAGVEFRYLLYKARDPNEAILGMDLAVFADYGKVWERYDFKNNSYNGKRLPAMPVAAVGLGTRIRTLIGPLRVDVGYKLQDVSKLKVLNASGTAVENITRDNADNISRIALQVTLGQAF